MSNFNINPSFSTTNFDKSISDFNNNFSVSLNQNQSGFDESSSFQNIMNSINQDKIEPLELSANYIEVDNKKEISPTAKLAQDIKEGFSNGIEELNNVNKKAENDMETFASGGDISVHEVMISAQKSSLALQMAIQLRSQMISAYNEFKNMTV